VVLEDVGQGAVGQPPEPDRSVLRGRGQEATLRGNGKGLDTLPVAFKDANKGQVGDPQKS